MSWPELAEVNKRNRRKQAEAEALWTVQQEKVEKKTDDGKFDVFARRRFQLGSANKPKPAPAPAAAAAAATTPSPATAAPAAAPEVLKVAGLTVPPPPKAATAVLDGLDDLDDLDTSSLPGTSFGPERSKGGTGGRGPSKRGAVSARSVVSNL